MMVAGMLHINTLPARGVRPARDPSTPTRSCPRDGRSNPSAEPGRQRCEYLARAVRAGRRPVGPAQRWSGRTQRSARWRGSAAPSPDTGCARGRWRCDQFIRDQHRIIDLRRRQTGPASESADLTAKHRQAPGGRVDDPPRHRWQYRSGNRPRRQPGDRHFPIPPIDPARRIRLPGPPYLHTSDPEGDLTPKWSHQTTHLACLGRCSGRKMTDSGRRSALCPADQPRP